MSSATEQIKERLSIVDVLSSYIKLDKAGANYKARCPFHNEKTPSFVVSPSRNTYHCFGCNRGGDIFSFVEEIEGLDFKRALEILADRAGVVLERIDPKLKSEESRLYSILEEATKYFESQLAINSDAKDYLKGRGVSDESVSNFRIGYVRDEWRGLLTHLKGKNFTESDIERVGLIIKSEKGYYDRFRGRIMFPIMNAQGKVVGYSGRYFVSKDNFKTDSAKYINSPETILYNKSKILFGFDKAKQAIMQKDSAVLVEGQMDLVMSHQAGVTNTVASSGTALTDEHLKMIKRFTPNIIMAFDADAAGFSASERGFNLAFGLGMEIRIAKLPKGIDPADLVAKDKEEWFKAVREAKHIINFYLDSLLEAGLDERKLKGEVSKKVLPYVGMIRNRIDQAHFVGIIAQALGIDEAPIWDEVKKQEVRAFQVEKEVSQAVSTREEKIRDKIAGIIFWQEDIKDTPQIDVVVAKERFESLGGNTKIAKEEKENLILQAEIYYSGRDDVKKELENLFLTLEQVKNEDELKKGLNLMRIAEQSKNEIAVQEILKKIDTASKKINEIKDKLRKSEED